LSAETADIVLKTFRFVCFATRDCVSLYELLNRFSPSPSSNDVNWALRQPI